MENDMSTIFVMPEDENWVVKSESSENIISTHDSREAAIEAAKEVAMGDDSSLVILRHDGTIDNLGLYGIAPFPSKDSAPEYNDEEGDADIG